MVIHLIVVLEELGGDGLYTQIALLRLVVLVEVAVVPVVMVLMVLTQVDLRVDSCIAGKGGLGRAAFLGDTGIPSSYGTSGPGPGRWFAGGGAGGNHDAPPPAGGAAPDGGGGGAWWCVRAPPTPVSGTGQVNTGGGGGGGGGLANAYPGPLGQGGGTGILIVRIATSRLS